MLIYIIAVVLSAPPNYDIVGGCYLYMLKYPHRYVTSEFRRMEYAVNAQMLRVYYIQSSLLPPFPDMVAN